jgi:hypothetical protein
VRLEPRRHPPIPAGFFLSHTFKEVRWAKHLNPHHNSVPCSHSQKRGKRGTTVTACAACSTTSSAMPLMRCGRTNSTVNWMTYDSDS